MRSTIEERRVRELLDALAAEVEPLSDDELGQAARTAAATPRTARPARRGSPPARWALVLAATAALALAGGIGVGRSLAPEAQGTGVETLPAVAPAFAIAPGWHVVGSGIALPFGVRAAIASNVRLPVWAPLDLEPRGVLDALPEDGILIVAALRSRDPERGLPALAPRTLRLAAVPPSTLWQGPEGAERAFAEYELAARSGGHDLELRVYLGTATPSARLLAEAQEQLDRVTVGAAPQQVTLAVRPTLLRLGDPVTLTGAVANGRAGERVTVEMRECGLSHFRVVGSATTGSGGAWTTQSRDWLLGVVGISGTFRARWGEHTSGTAAVRVRPNVSIDWRGGNFRISVGGVRSFYRKRVALQRFDAKQRRWITIRNVLLTDTFGAGNFISSQAKVRVAVPRGTLVRAVISNQQAGPCYLAGYSNMLRR